MTDRPSSEELVAVQGALIERLETQAALQQQMVERLEAHVGLQAELIGRLETSNVALALENVELRRRLGLDSGNSSKPPSTDGPDKAPATSLRKKTGRSSGGQKGRGGKRLEQVADPDTRQIHRPEVCGGCAAPLGSDGPETGTAVVRQVFDLPQVSVHVTEHRMVAVACPCGHVTRAGAPAGVAGPTSLGPGISAVAVYLSVAQMIPIDRVAATIEALYGISVSTGWVSLVLGRASAAVAGANEVIRAKITDAPLAYFDESMTKVASDRCWFHAAATEKLTAYHADEHGRGLGAIEKFGILTSFTGTAVHDAYSAYYSDRLGQDHLTHALCIAHVQRELRAIAEHDPTAGKDGWAAEADNLIENMFRWRATYRHDGQERLAGFKLDKTRRQWDDLVERALALHPHVPGRPGGQTHARRLAVRMQTRKDDYLRWLGDFTVPATSNIAEQAVRMIKTKTKVSGGFRTLKGLQQFLAIRGYTDTLRKNARHIITDLQDALTGNTWAPA